MATVLLPDLPYDALQHLFTHLSPVDVLHCISSSRKLYYPLIDDASTWRPFCTPFGINSTSFRGRSFRIIYGRLLHRYGALIGLWCSDYPFEGNIVEFRLLPDHRLREGELVIVGDVWKLPATVAQSRPCYPTYIEFVQIGFTPWRKTSPKIADEVHISWYQRSEQDLGALDLNATGVEQDGGNLSTPSLHVLAPTNLTVEVFYLGHPLNNPEFPENTKAAWYDADRGVPRLQQEDPPPIVQTPLRHFFWLPRTDTLYYSEGVPKPASISIFPSPPDQPSNVRFPDLHNPTHPLSSLYLTVTPRYFPLRTIMQEGMDPRSPDWRPETLVGLWLGDYGPHGTECLFLEHEAAAAQVRAWKVTGDVNVPRGVCTWHANLSAKAPWEDQSGRRLRAYEGMGRIAHHGFIDSSETPARVIMSGRDEITVEWHAFFVAKFIRYRTERGRTGEQ
ncbi:hypothetical protein C8Q80DRAFT_1271017 [Daedaleopsis nitida]|nr:hypothetical protein C8Q80DRAFT_1271017 [Daedaleopsis nitida]